MRWKSPVIAQALLAVLILVACSVGEQTQVADVVYHGGQIYTVNKSMPWAESVAIRGQAIVFVGSDDAVQQYIGPDTQVFDLKNKMLLPAFQDGHIHPISSALDLLGCSLYDTWTLPEYLEIVARCAAEDPEREWIRGGGWSLDVFGPGGIASKKLLDEVVPDRPVYLESKDGHTAWLNSLALELIGINKDTPNPTGGIIDRDPVTGEAIGSLQEDALLLAYEAMPESTLEERIEGLRYARDMLHKIGITAMQTGYSDETDLQAITALDKRQELGLRVVTSFYWDAADPSDQLPAMLDLRERYEHGNLRPHAVKIFQDGVLENFTGGLLEPYRTEQGGYGMQMFEPAALNTLVTRVDAVGMRLHCHAIGDRATRQCLDAVEAARAANGDSGLRHTLTHIQLIHPEEYGRFAELDAVANFQPYWAIADEYVTELVAGFISEEAYQRQYPIRSVIDAGGHVAFGSDWAVSSADPLLGIETAMTRLEPEDQGYPPLNTDQAITLEQAIRGYTIEAAYQLHHEDKTGSIEVGKLADLVVLDRNLFEIAPAEIDTVSVVLTLFGGNPVYGDPAGL